MLQEAKIWFAALSYFILLLTSLKTGFENWILNYPNRKRNYFSCIISSKKKNSILQNVSDCTNESKTGFINRKWNYSNRKWNYSYYFLTSYQTTSFKKCFYSMRSQHLSKLEESFVAYRKHILIFRKHDESQNNPKSRRLFLLFFSNNFGGFFVEKWPQLPLHRINSVHERKCS